MARPASPEMMATRKGGDRESSAASTDTIDTRLVQELATLLASTDLTEIEVEKGDLRIRVARGGTQGGFIAAPPPVAMLAPAPAAAAIAAAPVATKPADLPGAVKSPMVGTAYRRPNPEAKAFVDVGATVAAGDRVMLVEAMKTFNEIVAPRGGTVSAILVEDGQPVEYGQVLLVID